MSYRSVHFTREYDEPVGFDEKKAAAASLSGGMGAVSLAQAKEEQYTQQIREAFQTIAGKSMEINAKQLQRVLNATVTKSRSYDNDSHSEYFMLF